MNQRMIYWIGFLLLCGWLFGCAHSPDVFQKSSEEEFFQYACSPGSEVTEVRGSVRMQAKSQEASGKFPAHLIVKKPRALDMEITNPLGGTEAKIAIRGSRFKIQIPEKPEQSFKGHGSWGGIPLEWSTDLFLGRIPCPRGEDEKDLQFEMTREDELSVRTPSGELFTYQFENYLGNPWPKALVWRNKGRDSVKFQFFKPEKFTKSPLKWIAQSKKGLVKVQWRIRKKKLSTEP